MRNTFLLVMILLLAACTPSTDKIDLSGTWTVRLDSADVGIAKNWQGQIWDTPIQLPGTTDDAGLGVHSSLEPELTKPQLLHLTRQNSYVGPAWYAREIRIPETWENKDCILKLERVLWDTQVWVDGTPVKGHEESLTTPHFYDLTRYVKPGGQHLLSIRVDNRKRHDISNDLAHAYTDHTQIKWNGLLGELSIEAVEKVRVAGLQLFPDVENKTVKAVVSLLNNTSFTQDSKLKLVVAQKSGSKKYSAHTQQISIEPGESVAEIIYEMGSEFVLWNEFTPELYKATVVLEADKAISEVSEDFGMRSLYSEENRLMLKGTPMLLRGTLECCIFPLTGTPPMDKEGWYKVFRAAKDYGLNHLRFHSWCPPQAAFQVADEMGFYLQVELPVWVLTIGKDAGAVRFMKEEAERIIRNYGNHPSFCLWSLGNELQGDFTILSDMLNDLKAEDPRHLYTTTSFTFEKGHGVLPEPNDDFFVTQWTNRGWIRGQGVFNKKSPAFDKDYSDQVKDASVPIITHEIGQYSVYPDLTEISKYTGVLKPLNFMAVKNDLERKGLLDKAPSYLEASGKLAAILYKEEIERALKTKGISGFQLLDLHDFPGQGTALVGLLNAFWESKGIISGEEFREFCSPVVPLLRFPKAVYTNGEVFTGEMELCNYGPDILTGKTLKWKVTEGDKVVKEGTVDVAKLQYGYNGGLGTLSIPLKEIQTAAKLEVSLWMDGTNYANKWNIWVYPETALPDLGIVKYTRDYDEALARLQKGETVLFNPDWKTMKGIEGKFVPVFWSPVHFPKQAGTMGILCNPEHKALSAFPTDMHTDWQWWDLLINSTTMVVDSLQGGNPIVEVVDNFTNNRRLSSLLEGRVGEGKLVLVTFDLATEIERRPVAKQMLSSLLGYMNSPEFDPAVIVNFENMGEIFGTVVNKKESEKSIY